MEKSQRDAKTLTLEQVLSVEKGQREFLCDNKDFERCSFSAGDHPTEAQREEALEYLAKIIVNSYLRNKGL